MNTVDYLLIAGLVIAVASVLVFLNRRKKKGGGCCGGSSCEGCSGCPLQNQEEKKED